MVGHRLSSITDSELVLHIGLPKTATTSIQDNLFENSEYLLHAFKIDYHRDLCNLAEVKCTGHHPLAWDLFNPQHEHRKSIDHLTVKEHLATAQRHLLSSEWFVQASFKQITELVELWQLPSRRKVVIVYRDEFAHVKSLWLQAVKMGLTFLPFEQFYFQRYKPNRSTLKQKCQRWLNNGFDVQVINFEELIANESSPGIYFVETVYNIKVDGSQWIETGKSNVSPSINIVEYYRRLVCMIDRLSSNKLSSRKTAEKLALHNKCCTMLEKVTLLLPNSPSLGLDVVQRDISQMPPYYDF